MKVLVLEKQLELNDDIDLSTQVGPDDVSKSNVYGGHLWIRYSLL